MDLRNISFIELWNHIWNLRSIQWGRCLSKNLEFKLKIDPGCKQEKNWLNPTLAAVETRWTRATATSKRLCYHHDGSVLTLLSSVHVGNEVIIISNRTCRLLFSETTRPNARARVRPERPHRVQGRRNDLGQFLPDTLTLFQRGGQIMPII